ARYENAATPRVTRPTASTANTAILHLLANMVFNAPSARVAAGAAIAPAPAARPAPKSRAFLIVVSNNRLGTAAAAFSASARAKVLPDRTTPRRVKQARNNSRARANRLLTVPGGQPSWRAASVLDLPSR